MPHNRAGFALSRCEQCHRQSAEVIESRRTGTAARRRKRCIHCHHRFTEYELPAAEFQRLTSAAKALDAIRRTLGAAAAPAPEPAAIPCDTCAFCRSEQCDFGYPEFGTPDAADCSTFQAA